MQESPCRNGPCDAHAQYPTQSITPYNVHRTRFYAQRATRNAYGATRDVQRATRDAQRTTRNMHRASYTTYP
eukprot:5600964-Lingulodinium_polyedra.AAC.1